VSAFSLFPEGGETQGDVPVRTLGHERGWISWQFHINWRKERVPARTLGLEEEWIVMSHIDWGGEQNTMYKGVETFP